MNTFNLVGKGSVTGPSDQTPGTGDRFWGHQLQPDRH